MADPLLTSLCAICHTSAPKYKCPRCDIRTCSLACVKKHKAWSECSGERDQTSFVPASKLRTAAGVDHDYNFLHGIELKSERAEKLLTGEKHIIQEEDLHPTTVEEVRWKTIRGRKQRVVVTRVVRDNRKTGDRLLAARLKKLNTVVVTMPYGMSRNKENNTTIHRKSGRIHWQVEWFAIARAQGGGEVTTQTRALSKVMDDVPMCRAYQAVLDGQARTEGRLPKKPFKATGQNTGDLGWHGASDILQNPETGLWVAIQDASLDEWPPREGPNRKFQFLLGSMHKRTNIPTTVTRVRPDQTLGSILTNTKVLEFPTIYVLEAGVVLPPSLVLGPKDEAPLPEEKGLQDAKRKGGPQTNDRRGFDAKRRKPNAKGILEDGEVGGDGEVRDWDIEDNSKEADDVLVERILDDEEEDDDDEGISDVESTSSSGSDTSGGSDSE